MCRDVNEQLQGKAGGSPEAAGQKKITKQSLPTVLCVFELAVQWSGCLCSHPPVPTGQLHFQERESSSAVRDGSAHGYRFLTAAKSGCSEKEYQKLDERIKLLP